MTLVRIVGRADVEHARRAARTLAQAHAFTRDDAELMAIAVSELATNLLRYAVDGEITLSLIEGPRGTGVQVESRDGGPGIADVDLAFRDGFSTGGGLGGGLAAVRRIMDEVEIATTPSGTRITGRKWPNRRS